MMGIVATYSTYTIHPRISPCVHILLSQPVHEVARDANTKLGR